MDLGVIIAIVAAVIVVLVVIGTIVSRIEVSDPDEAIIISGSKDEASQAESKIVLGGGKAFIVPFVQKANRLSLETRQITWQVRESPSSQNIFVNLEGVANVKVGGDKKSVRAAIERFNVNPDNIKEFTRQNIESDMRAIVGTMTVEDINGNREALKERVTSIIADSFAQWGLVLETLSIQSVTTPGGYMDDLSRPQAAEARKKAEIAEAINKRQAAEAQAEADKAVAEADRGVALKRAEVKAATDQANENAAAAGPIAKAQQRQAILEQEREAERKRAEVTEQELESTVRKPADAKAYATKVEAEAERDASISKAEGDAKQVELAGAAEGAATKAKGEAEAEVIKARGLAEAEAIQKKSEAFQDYPQAGMLDLALGEGGVAGVARAVAEPISGIDSLTVVSTDGMNKVTKGATDMVTQTFGTIDSVAGFDVLGLLKGLGGGNSAETSESDEIFQQTKDAAAAIQQREAAKRAEAAGENVAEDTSSEDNEK